jgi:hypothetical protein
VHHILNKQPYERNSLCIHRNHCTAVPNVAVQRLLFLLVFGRSRVQVVEEYAEIQRGIISFILSSFITFPPYFWAFLHLNPETSYIIFHIRHGFEHTPAHTSENHYGARILHVYIVRYTYIQIYIAINHAILYTNILRVHTHTRIGTCAKKQKLLPAQKNLVENNHRLNNALF